MLNSKVRRFIDIILRRVNVPRLSVWMDTSVTKIKKRTFGVVGLGNFGSVVAKGLLGIANLFAPGRIRPDRPPSGDHLECVGVPKIEGNGTGVTV